MSSTNSDSGGGFRLSQGCSVQPPLRVARLLLNVCPSWCFPAIRILGWVNWTSTPCAGAAEWVCGGRGSEASDNYIYYTAQEAGEDYAAEYFQELFDSKCTVRFCFARAPRVRARLHVGGTVVIFLSSTVCLLLARGTSQKTAG